MIPTVLTLLFALLFLGSPVFIALSLATFAGFLFFSDISPTIVLQRTFGGIDKYVLICLPLYILGAEAMDVGGLASRMIRWCKAIIGHVSGGLAMATQAAAMFFGALAGSSPATVTAVGRILYPQLLREGYGKTFASGLIIQSGAVSLLIPPSITLVLYAFATNTSIGALYAGGMGSGIFFGLVTLLYIYYYAQKNKHKGATRATPREIVGATKDAFWSLFATVIIIGGIFAGLFTVTEAAAVAAVYAIVVGAFVYKEITWKKLYELCLSSAITTAKIMIVIAGASTISWILTIGQVPQQVATFLTENFHTSWSFLLFLNFVLLVLGMFLEASIALVVIAPLILSSAVSLGIDPIHLGIIMVTNLAIGMFTPPFGLNIFVSKSITRMTMMEILPGLWRFIWVSLIALLFITYIPWITMAVPKWLGY